MKTSIEEDKIKAELAIANESRINEEVCVAADKQGETELNGWL